MFRISTSGAPLEWQRAPPGAFEPLAPEGLADRAFLLPAPVVPGGGFRVVTSSRTVACENVLITSGGKSYPGCGTTGDGYVWAAAFGHTIVPQRPALVPLTVQAAWIGELRGITLPDVNLKVLSPDGKPLTARRGSLLFAHFGLTGPAPLDASRAVSGEPSWASRAASPQRSPRKS